MQSQYPAMGGGQSKLLATLDGFKYLETLKVSKSSNENKKGFKFGFTLVEGATHVDTFHNQRKVAFTLAEVLITLGIIGVVAAITIPTLVTNYQKKQTVIQLKKAYSELSQAVKLSEIQNGDVADWDFALPSKQFLDKYLTPFVKIREELAKETVYRNSKGKVINNNDSSVLGSWSKIKDNTATFTTTSGVTFFVDSWYPDTKDFRGIGVDINGTKKGPNVVGKDFFYFHITSNGGVKPSGYDKSREEILSTKLCSKEAITVNGPCAALIVKDGWEIKPDYPW